MWSKSSAQAWLFSRKWPSDCEFKHQLNQHSFQRLIKVNASNIIQLPPMGWQSMWKTSQLLGETVVWSTGVRKPGNTCVGVLAAVIWLKKNWKQSIKQSFFVCMWWERVNNLQVQLPLELVLMHWCLLYNLSWFYWTEKIICEWMNPYRHTDTFGCPFCSRLVKNVWQKEKFPSYLPSNQNCHQRNINTMT